MTQPPAQHSTYGGKAAFLTVLISLGIAGYHWLSDVYYNDLINTRIIRLDNRIDELRRCVHTRENLSDKLAKEIETFRVSNNWQGVVALIENLPGRCSDKIDGIQDALDQLNRTISPHDEDNE